SSPPTILLGSGSTRRAGIIALIDLLPSIFSELGISDRVPELSRLVGNPIRVVAATGSVSTGYQGVGSTFGSLEAALVHNDANRGVFIRGYILTLIVLLGCALLSRFWTPLS